jgi:hypothetical protein
VVLPKTSFDIKRQLLKLFDTSFDCQTMDKPVANMSHPEQNLNEDGSRKHGACWLGLKVGARFDQPMHLCVSSAFYLALQNWQTYKSESLHLETIQIETKTIEHMNLTLIHVTTCSKPQPAPCPIASKIKKL